MAGIVFGCIVPHPPLIVPDIGKGQEQDIPATVSAMEQLRNALERSAPDVAAIVSPHGRSQGEAMGILTAPESYGDLAQWGDRKPKQTFKNDPALVRLVMEEAEKAGVPVVSLGERQYGLDHGVMVPLHFLQPAIAGLPLVPLTFSWLPLKTHYEFGKCLQRAAARSGKKVALIASGDLSHRLTPDAPAGYEPQGKVFDEKLVQAVGKLDVQAILSLDHELIERAGECGLRSVTILMGALDGLGARPRVLSYEGPFGVGYMVAEFEVASAGPADDKMHPLVKLAKETVEKYVTTGKMPRPIELTSDMKDKAGVFVCLKKHGELRGCIGTFEPTTPNIATETIMNAVSAAVRDPRFPPVDTSELPDLEYSVDVLTRPVPVEDQSKLDPKKHGLIVSCGYRRGLLLPDLEGVDTVEQQIEICCSKAGIIPGEPVKLSCFKVKRYK